MTKSASWVPYSVPPKGVDFFVSPRASFTPPRGGNCDWFALNRFQKLRVFYKAASMAAKIFPIFASESTQPSFLSLEWTSFPLTVTYWTKERTLVTPIFIINISKNGKNEPRARRSCLESPRQQFPLGWLRIRPKFETRNFEFEKIGECKDKSVPECAQILDGILTRHNTGRGFSLPCV